MSIKIEILAPDLPESVVDANVVVWHKKIGDLVQRDDVLVEIETDKIILEVTAIHDGILEKIIKKKGDSVIAHQVLGYLKHCKNSLNKKLETFDEKKIILKNPVGEKNIFSPSIRREKLKNNLFLKEKNKKEKIKNNVNENKFLNKKIILDTKELKKKKVTLNEKRVPMTRLRKRMIERLLETKNNTVTLTTFNEVNMQKIITLRKNYQQLFTERYNVRLGFMPFYVQAVVAALKKYPEFNAYIDHEDIIYRYYFNISIAVSTKRGLITPVLHQVDQMSIATIEKKIKEFTDKGNNNTLKIEELTGGNFTITNGGVFGSLMSTPIINPPQSAILGIHLIKDRPAVLRKKILILPMMYIALSYDHRIADGREAVSFLVMIKEILEDPNRLILNI